MIDLNNFIKENFKERAEGILVSLNKEGVKDLSDLLSFSDEELKEMLVKINLNSMDTKRMKEQINKLKIPNTPKGELHKFLCGITDLSESADILNAKLMNNGVTSVGQLASLNASELITIGVKDIDARKIRVAKNKISLNYRGTPDILAVEQKPLLYAGLLDLISQVQQADICIICDITGSMEKYVNTIKKTIKDLLPQITKTTMMLPRFAFVGYRDHKDEEQFVIHDFTDNCDKLIQFLDNVKIEGGGDQCEDIKGALKVASKLKWRNNFMMVVLIADAPTHGKNYHDAEGDDFPEEDKQPNIEDLIIAYSKCVHLTMIKCNHTTDKMSKIFSTLYARSPMVYQDFLLEGAEESLKLPFFTTFSNAFNTSIRAGRYKVTPIIEEIKNEEYESRATVIGEPIKIKFHRIDSIINPDFSFLGKDNSTNLYKSKLGIDFKFAPGEWKDFCVKLPKIASGTFRNAYKLFNPSQMNEEYILKVSKETGQFSTIESIKEEFANYVVSNYLASQFNKFYKETPLIFFDCLVGEISEEDLSSKPYLNKNRFVFVERFMEGNFQKFSNNYGWVMETYIEKQHFSKPFQLSQAFSHWTYEHSGGVYLVVDLQGFYDESTKKLYLTDPAVHSSLFSGHFGLTNIGKYGVTKFCLTHKCDTECEFCKLYPIQRILNSSPAQNLEEYKKTLNEYQAKSLVAALMNYKPPATEPFPKFEGTEEIMKKAKIVPEIP